MLLDLITSRRNELISRSRARVAKRFAPDGVPTVVEHGVPLFLDQLADTLRAERKTNVRPITKLDPTPTSSAIGRAAAAHGVELLHLGYTVDQVVHHYGDVCQAIAELAIEQHATISADQFRTLNRCLDEAIADAVSAFAHDREAAVADRAVDLQERFGQLADQQRHLLALAIETFAAIQGGQVAAGGASGTALLKMLRELRDIVDRAWPELRLASGMTHVPADAPLAETERD
jgi:hypothetical protein